jgi:hypothetical protein
VSFWSPVLLSGLTLGDYLLWNWSLNANHDVLALIAGLSLPALALASVWLLALGLLRLIGSSTRRSVRGALPAAAAVAAKRDPLAAEARRDERPPTTTVPSAPSSGKLAA